MPLDPTLPEMVEDPLLRRLLMLEDRLSRLEQSNPLVRAQVNDDEGRKRLRIGYLDPSSDAAGFGMEIFDTSSASIFRATEAGLTAAVNSLTVGGGTIRAIDATRQRVSTPNVTITTTLATHVTNTHTKPTWANQALVYASTQLQVSNFTGSTFNIVGDCLINGAGGTSLALQTSIASNETGSVSPSNVALLTSPGTTVVIEGGAQITSGTNTTNQIALVSLVIWLR